MYDDHYVDESRKISGCLLGIEYYDGKKRWNDFVIRADYFKRTDSGIALCAICEETKKRKQFKIDRIESLTDLDSGEVFRNGYHWIKDLGFQFVKDADTYPRRSKFFDPLLTEASIVLFVAAADGHMNEEKTEAVRQYCHSILPSPIESATERDKFERAVDKFIEEGGPDSPSPALDKLREAYSYEERLEFLDRVWQALLPSSPDGSWSRRHLTYLRCELDENYDDIAESDIYKEIQSDIDKAMQDSGNAVSEDDLVNIIADRLSNFDGGFLRILLPKSEGSGGSSG